MASLDEGARIAVEKNVDSIIKKAKMMEVVFSHTLSVQGIEPNLETVLSYMMGLMTGIVEGLYITKFKRLLNPEEMNELNNLLKRRAWEIREAFIGTRID